MGSSQKYTEEKFEIDEYFLKQLKEFDFVVSTRIAAKIDDLSQFMVTDGYIEELSSYVNNEAEEAVFFNIEYYRDEEGPVVLVDINELELDNYLDQINLNKHAK